MVESWEYRWASETGAQGMPHPEELEYLGYERLLRHRFWPDSILYRRPAPAPDRGPTQLVENASPSKELANRDVRPDGGSHH